MIRKFNNFTNENVNDYLQPRDLNEEQKMIYDVIKEIESLGFEVNAPIYNDGIYNFRTIRSPHYISVYYMTKENNKGDSVHGHKLGWQTLTTNTSRGERTTNFFENDHDLIFYIIHTCYPNIDSTIEHYNFLLRDAKQKVENYENELKGIKKAKKNVR